MMAADLHSIQWKEVTIVLCQHFRNMASVLRHVSWKGSYCSPLQFDRLQGKSSNLCCYEEELRRFRHHQTASVEARLSS